MGGRAGPAAPENSGASPGATGAAGGGANPAAAAAACRDLGLSAAHLARAREASMVFALIWPQAGCLARCFLMQEVKQERLSPAQVADLQPAVKRRGRRSSCRRPHARWWRSCQRCAAPRSGVRTQAACLHGAGGHVTRALKAWHNSVRGSSSSQRPRSKRPVLLSALGERGVHLFPSRNREGNRHALEESGGGTA